MGIGGLHNLSLSTKHEGCLWVSLQMANTILLLDVITLTVRKILRDPQSGELWVALKATVPCCPSVDPPGAGADARLKTAALRTCCSIEGIKAYMALHNDMGYECPTTDDMGFAVWRIDPDKYDAKSVDRGRSDLEHLDTTEVLDVRTMAFAPGPAMGSGRFECAAVAVDAQHLLDLATMAFAPGPTMGTPRDGCAAARLVAGPRILVVDGEDPNLHGAHGDDTCTTEVLAAA
ncbi:hypothetical protein M885DRAFT_573273 [Pelagophyceae sp. CCMP2097]|nr:hypothetical protein M885DRAFT_573273 [Pelagophyceae sp. CCMP2097]